MGSRLASAAVPSNRSGVHATANRTAADFKSAVCARYWKVALDAPLPSN
jgi:hypothetical protein